MSDKPLTIKAGVLIGACTTVLGTIIWFSATAIIGTVQDHERRITRVEATMDAAVKKLDSIDSKLDRVIERAAANGR